MNDAHLYLHVGGSKRFALVLGDDGVYWGWSRPVVLAPSVVHLLGVHDRYRDGVAASCLVTGRIVALAPGTTYVESSTDLPCFHATPPCLPASETWRVRVTVTS